MKYLLFIFITAINFNSLYTHAQILPPENTKLNYRLAGFRVPTQQGAATYSFEIATGMHKEEKSFKNATIITQSSTENRAIVLLPEFGQPYTWRVVYKDKNDQPKGRTQLYHCTTDTISYIDTNRYRLRVIDSATAYKDMLILMDSRVMYDMGGNPVWFLPTIGEKMPENAMPRDLKPTEAGTFTFLRDNNAYEIDYNGNILWEAPHGTIHKDTVEAYHHEYTRLQNGNYMIANQETLMLEDSNLAPYPVICGSLVEFDSAGKLIWEWKSSQYFLNSSQYKANDGRLYIYPHLNAFYFYEKNKIIYLSFRNTSNILKIRYPSGEVLADYSQDTLFEGQHSCRIGSDGLLYLFNNNMGKGKFSHGPNRGKNPSNAVSTLVKFQELPSGYLKKVWEYPCSIDNEAKPCALSGGGVYELADGSFLACMGAEGRVFIVSPGKKTVWNAVPEQRPQGTWRIWQQYRASFIANTTALEKFIFR